MLASILKPFSTSYFCPRQGPAYDQTWYERMYIAAVTSLPLNTSQEKKIIKTPSDNDPYNLPFRAQIFRCTHSNNHCAPPKDVTTLGNNGYSAHSLLKTVCF